MHAGEAKRYRCVCSERFTKRLLYTARLFIAAFVPGIFCGLCLFRAADQAAKPSSFEDKA